MKKKKNTQLIYLIAGEPSGDAIGALLMRALIKLTNNNIEFYGIGGPKMVGSGLSSLFPMQELSVIGLTEIIPKLPNLINRINQTVIDIIKTQPKVIITIDAPDFCFRVAKRLKKSKIPIIHYVAPSVWAWRSSRAKEMVKHYNHILTLLPFEPPYFTEAGLPSTFVGHPVLESEAVSANADRFLKEYNINKNKKIVILLPGSRVGEIRQHLSIFLDTFLKLKKIIPDVYAVLIANETTFPLISKSAENWPFSHTIINDELKKFDALASGDIALAASGTVSLELACVGTPSIITYRINPFSAWLAKQLIKVKYANLVNLILDREAIPEFIQKGCNSDNLSKKLSNLLLSPLVIRQQKADYEIALNSLKSKNSNKPSISAAKIILDFLK